MKRSRKDLSLARRHTAKIDSPLHMWEKLAWDIDVFQDMQRRMPNEDQPLAYAAINACIAADSLGDWTRRQWKQSERVLGRQHTDAEFKAIMLAAVKGQAICTAIANTSKHHAFEERDWKGGTLELQEVEGTEDWPGGYELRYISGDEKLLAYGIFDVLPKDWWAFLCDLGICEGRQPSPKWYQNKLNRIFAEAPPAPEGMIPTPASQRRPSR